MEKFKKARETMQQTILKDLGLQISYVSNVAMLLYDKYNIKDYDIRNKAAEDILNLIFGQCCGGK